MAKIINNGSHQYQLMAAGHQQRNGGMAA